jgi:hypothetical protein
MTNLTLITSNKANINKLNAIYYRDLVDKV